MVCVFVWNCTQPKDNTKEEREERDSWSYNTVLNINDHRFDI